MTSCRALVMPLCWHRGPLPWMGHVALVTSYCAATGTMTVIEGNVGGRVVEATLAARERPRRMRGLYGVARADGIS